MRFNHLDDWLRWQESLNPAEIELGLDRVAEVLADAGLSSSFDCPLITVAGTNGKGSVVAMLESMAMSAALKVCSYTSPHLFHYNERIRIDGQPVEDDTLCDAFERIDQARHGRPLTYFEFGTLAAIDIFFRQQPDLVILEVGLGGRLDAVNIMQPDVSVLTSVAVDHIDWLGDNRESIGYEKAGIFRAGKPVICGEADVPATVLQHAEELACEFIRTGRDYSCTIDARSGCWSLYSYYQNLRSLAPPALAGDFQYNNAATAIVALQALARNISEECISAGLQQVSLAGRFQQINESPDVFVDVAHNPHAAKALASQLDDSRPPAGKTWAVIAMLADKDVAAVLTILCPQIDHWCFAGLDDINRGLNALQLQQKVAGIFAGEDLNTETKAANPCKMHGSSPLSANTVTVACEQVLAAAGEQDRIVVFGSFYTVAEAMNFFSDTGQTG